ncbi:hypothetical protein J2R90_007588 [Bradyrhizobium japonicum]|nr:hypothetical protein [Bradyrhizobium japonicum]
MEVYRQCCMTFRIESWEISILAGAWRLKHATTKRTRAWQASSVSGLISCGRENCPSQQIQRQQG